MKRRGAALLGAGLLALSLGACAHVPGLPAGARHVALGSSFAAGTAIGGVKPGTPERCGRSAANYATIAAGRLGLALDDQSCGGATTAHVLGPWNELPPQIDAVTPDTRLVTITIGGNDVGYVMNLFAASCPAGEGMVIQGTRRPCPQLRPPTAEDYARLESGLARIAQEATRRAPAARLVFVQYVRLVPDAPCAAVRLSPEGAIATRAIGERLAAITARVAEAEGAEILAADALSRQHTPCDAEPWSTGPALPAATGEPAPWHPNAAGHAAIAEALVALLER